MEEDVIDEHAALSVTDKVKGHHRKRISSYEALPPNMSELRLVLVGNSSSGICSVGNLLLGQTKFRHSDRCETSSRQYRGKNMVLVKTPDLLHPNLPEASVSALMEDCVKLSAPGPHVFILVLQPEHFTEQQKTRLQAVLENFSDQAFQHSLLLLLPPRGGPADSLEHYRRQSPLKDLIKQCRFRYLKQEDMEPLELITRVGQIVKENNGEHVRPNVSSDSLHLTPQTDLPVNVQSQAEGSGLNMILLGNSWSHRSSVGNLLLKKTVINTETKPLNFQIYEGEMHNRPLTVVNTPDLQDIDITDFTDCIRRLSGPLVFLLVLQPEDFTEKHKNNLDSVLQSCSEKAFDQSLVLIPADKTRIVQKLLNYVPFTGKRDHDQRIRDMIIKCKYRYLHINSTDDPNQKEFKREELFTRIGQMLKENKENLSCGPSQVEDTGLNLAASEENRPCLNLVLCGRAGAEKSSVIESIFGQGSVCMSPEECVRHQGKVCGRWVSLLELPPLSGSGKPEEELMEQCLHFLSCCGPQGVQAFILVLPLDPLTDEDKSELRSIQDVFSSAVCPFTMILFTVDSDSCHPDVEGTDLQELYQPYAGHLIFNTRGQHQVAKLLDSLKTFSKNKPHSYTTETLIYGQKKMITTLREIQDLQVKRTVGGSEASADCLRITLMGRTGHGKSSSGNTILGRSQFRSIFSSGSVTQSCEKAEADVDGRHITVVDTPGLFDTRMSNENIIDEMTKCISLLAPGPHVFLLVLELGRFTEEENKTIDLIQKSFGKESQKYTMILFTHGDKLEGKSSIEEYMRRSDSSLKKVLSDCGNRFHLFNNKDKTNVSQVKELLKKIDAMVEENGGGCFTNDMFQHAEVTIKKEMERIMKEKEEEMRREREEMERKYQQEMEDIKLQMEKQKEQTEKDREQREQELREKEEKIKVEEKRRKEMERIMKEKEEKMWREREETERKYQQEMEGIKHEMDKQKEQIETEIKEREQELREKEEKIKKEEEQREKEQEQREEEERKRREQEEHQRQESEQRQKELEEKIKSESESKEATEQKLQESRRKMEEQKEKWEKDREDWWQQRKEENEEKEKQSKAREEQQRQEWEQRQKELEEKIKSESESKEATEQKLLESRRKMDQEKEKWENEREEWQQKSKQEDEEKRQYLKNLHEEYDSQRLKDHEQRREEDRNRKQQEDEMKRKYQQEMEDIKLKMEKQIETDRKQREQELRDKEEMIKMEEKRRKTDQEKREEEERKRREQEERQRQELEQRQKELEEKIQSESESKEATEQKQQESRRKMDQEKEKWEREREDWQQKSKQEDEEKQRYLKNLHEEYDKQRLKDHEQRREEDRNRKQQEEEMKRKYQQEMEDIKLKMEKQKEQTETDRKQREQELKEKEEKIKVEEKRRKEMERIMKEKEEKMRREREETERKYQQEMEGIKHQMDKQKEQTETEIKEKEQELREKEEKIKIEEDLRKKEQKQREEEETKRREQEEHQHQGLEQRQKELEEKIKSESEAKEATEQKLQESRRKMEEQKEKWEKDREDWWQQRKEENEEKEKQSKAREEHQRQEWKQKQKELEEKIKSESESKEAIKQKLQESRRKMDQDKEKWENEREEWEQKRKQEDEEKQQNLKILHEDYDKQRLKDQEQRQEEDRIRNQQEEENMNKLKKKYEKEIEDSKKASEKEARTKAEEEFQRKEKEKIEEHRKHINSLVECICRKERNVKRINKKIKANKEQMSKVTDEKKKEELLKDQEKELSELIQKMLEEEDDSRLHKILKSLMFPFVYQVYEDWLVKNEDKAQAASTIPEPTSAAASSAE